MLTRRAFLMFASALWVMGACSQGPSTTVLTPAQMDAQRSELFFRVKLSAFGDDPRTSFGADLSRLALDVRRLRTLPPDVAFNTTRAAVAQIVDTKARRAMMLELFNQIEE